MITRARVLFGCLLLVATACGDDDPVAPTALPDPGPLQVIVQSPFADDGALILSVGGGPVDSIAAPGLTLTGVGTAGGGRRVLVRGAIASGPVLTIFVPDRRAQHAYTAKVEAAASRTTYAQRAPSEYRLVVSRRASSR
jgi:hypothetical protein